MTNLTTLFQKITELGKIHGLSEDWLEQRPYLFTDATIELPAFQKNQIIRTISAIETIIALPTFQAQVLSHSSQIPLNSSVFFCYDFHLTPTGPKLIEINTNAGGAFFIALLEETQGKKEALNIQKTRFIQMFLNEWRQVHDKKPLKSIAIVDDDPLNQYFYPEFLLFQSLFRAHNIDAMIADPALLFRQNGQLKYQSSLGDMSVDLVYNRLTDFDLSEPKHQVLKQAYLENEVVLTPHPHAYALYANKRNLSLLSNEQLLKDLGVEQNMIALLQNTIPRTFMVDAKNAENLWQQRKTLFFKPISSYGGKGVYRGKNITTRVFKSILEGGYIAQTLVPPSEITIDGLTRKIDFRAYVYRGEILGFAARLYQGQITNFRMPGGGFAMVKVGS